MPDGWEGVTAGIGLCFLWVRTKYSEQGNRRMIYFKIYYNQWIGFLLDPLKTSRFAGTDPCWLSPRARLHEDLKVTCPHFWPSQRAPSRLPPRTALSCAPSSTALPSSDSIRSAACCEENLIDLSCACWCSFWKQKFFCSKSASWQASPLLGLAGVSRIRNY